MIKTFVPSYIHVLWRFKSLDIDLEWLQWYGGDDVVWQLIQYPDGCQISINGGAAIWVLYRCWCPLEADPVWLNRGDSSMAIRKWTIRHIIVVFALIIIWCKISYSRLTNIVGTLSCSHELCPFLLYSFCFVDILLCVWLPDSKLVLYLRSDQFITSVLDGGRIWWKMSL